MDSCATASWTDYDRLQNRAGGSRRLTSMRRPLPSPDGCRRWQRISAATSSGARLRSVFLQRLAQHVDDLVDVGLLGDQRRGDDAGIACELDVQSVGEQPLGSVVAANARLAVDREVDAGEHAVA